MHKVANLTKNELRLFHNRFDTAHEDKAIQSRGRFLRAFPLRKPKGLTVSDYVIGKRTASFCAFVEAKTRAWASIQGSPAFKFGIYFGKTRSDPVKRYRVTRKFGLNKRGGFRNVKAALLRLIQAAKAKDFARIDKNPLSQMFKAKILSLYFPDDYFNVCSSEHLKLIASKLGIAKRPYTSEYQHLLAKAKRQNAITKQWSNPKFMRFLFWKFVKTDAADRTIKVRKPSRKIHRKVNLDDLTEARGAIGRASERFALAWEKERLTGLGRGDLRSQIEDKRDRPSHGFDFLSFTTADRRRLIEVKSAGKDRQSGGYRVYIS